MQPWNLALRFVLELGALAGLTVGGWSLSGRSGRAPVPVPGLAVPTAGSPGGAGAVRE